MATDKNIKILIVDDSLIARRFIRVYLGKMQITNVVEAPNVRTAFKELNKGGIDLILSDWSMPGTSGLAFLKTVRNDENFKNIPFVMVTAEGLKGSIAEAFNAGVTHYILKPYTYETFRKEIETVFKNERRR